jgi:hypothetical protein
MKYKPSKSIVKIIRKVTLYKSNSAWVFSLNKTDPNLALFLCDQNAIPHSFLIRFYLNNPNVVEYFLVQFCLAYQKLKIHLSLITIYFQMSQALCLWSLNTLKFLLYGKRHSCIIIDEYGRPMTDKRCL